MKKPFGSSSSGMTLKFMPKMPASSDEGRKISGDHRQHAHLAVDAVADRGQVDFEQAGDQVADRFQRLDQVHRVVVDVAQVGLHLRR